MANFAKIGLNNIVLDVQLIDNVNCMTPDGVEKEEVGAAYLARFFGHETWLKTSFNTLGGKHKSGGVPFRKNYAVVGGRYDADLDAFIPPLPFKGWVLNTETCLWEPPVPIPDDDNKYVWDEDTFEWVVVV